MPTTQAARSRHPRPNAAQLARVRAELARVSHEVATLPRPVLARMLPVLETAQRELRRDLVTWVRRQKGAERFTPQAYRVSLLKLDAALATIRRGEDETLAGLRRMGVDAGVMSAGHVSSEVRQLSAIFDSVDRSLQIDPAAVVVRGDELCMARWQRASRKYARDVTRDLQAQLAVGMVRGETYDSLAGRLQELKPAFSRYTGWASRLARTESAAAYQACVTASLYQAARWVPDLMQRWDASLDSRVCKRCGALDGETAPLGGMFAGDIPGPPLHPNCRCRAGAWRRSWGELMSEEAA